MNKPSPGRGSNVVGRVVGAMVEITDRIISGFKVGLMVGRVGLGRPGRVGRPGRSGLRVVVGIAGAVDGLFVVWVTTVVVGIGVVLAVVVGCFVVGRMLLVTEGVGEGLMGVVDGRAVV